MAVYLLLGSDEERKARCVEKLRKGRSVDAYDSAEMSFEEVNSTFRWKVIVIGVV